MTLEKAILPLQFTEVNKELRKESYRTQDATIRPLEEVECSTMGVSNQRIQIKMYDHRQIETTSQKWRSNCWQNVKRE